MDEQFNIENQYLMYLKRMKLNIHTMHPQQKIQLRQAFYGAFSQLLLLLQNTIPDIPDEDGCKALDSMVSQCTLYWDNQAKTGGI